MPEVYSECAQIVKPMQEMIKKDAIYSLAKREKYAFTLSS